MSVLNTEPLSLARRPLHGALSADSIRKDYVAAHLGDWGRDKRRQLPDK